MFLKISAKEKKRLKRAALGVSVVLALAALLLFTGASQKYEELTLDFRHAKSNRATGPSDQVVLIDIDDQSLKMLAPKYGRWPFPRKIYKEMIEFLSVGEPAVILFDILFTEPQLGSDDDQQLAEITKNLGNVSHAMQFLPESSLEGVSHVPLPSQITKEFSLKWGSQELDKNTFPMPLHDFSIPNPVLLKELPRIHVVSTEKDSDGIFRRMPLAVPYDGIWLPSLSLQALLAPLKAPIIYFKEGHLEVFDNAALKYKIPVQENGLYRLHFYDDSKRPRTFRLSEVIESAAAQQRGEDPSSWSVNPLDLQGKIVLIGASATGLEDLKATPVNKTYPGVLLHSTLISNVLQEDHVRSSSIVFSFIAVLFLVFIAYASVFYLDSIFSKTFLPLGALAAYFIMSLYAFKEFNLALGLVVPLASGFVAFIDSFIYMSFVEGRERRRMTGALSKYLSPDLAQIMVNEGVDPTAEVGTRKELSIMFSDVRGFTSMSEMQSAEQVVALLNEYLGAMTQIVFEKKGTLDKFIGDAVMAFWGAPLEAPDHARLAVETAFAMQKKLEELNQVWITQGKTPLAIGIGVNTGEVIVGNIGSEKRLDYTVIGDNVNLTSRLEGLTKYYGVGIVLGGPTFEKVKGDYLCRPLDLVKVKGKFNAVAIYEPLCLRSKLEENPKILQLANMFTEGWELYRKGEFKKAFDLFEKCLLLNEEDGPAQLYIERCRDLLEDPPEFWDGVYVAKTK